MYLGVQAGRARVGVAILLSERSGQFLKEWRCVDEQIVMIQLKIQGVWVSVVQVYASTDYCSDASKDECFVRLKETVRRVVSGDLLIVMGDMNARVGNDTHI